MFTVIKSYVGYSESLDPKLKIMFDKYEGISKWDSEIIPLLLKSGYETVQLDRLKKLILDNGFVDFTSKRQHIVIIYKDHIFK